VLHRAGQIVVGVGRVGPFQESIDENIKLCAVSLADHRVPLVVIGHARRFDHKLGRVVVGDQRDDAFGDFAHDQAIAMAAATVATLAIDGSLVVITGTGHAGLEPGRDGPVDGAEIERGRIAEVHVAGVIDLHGHPFTELARTDQLAIDDGTIQTVARTVVGVALEVIMRQQAGTVRLDRNDVLRRSAIEPDVVDIHNTCRTGTLDTNGQGADIAQVAADGGQIDDQRLPGRGRDVSIIRNLRIVDLDVQLSGVVRIAVELQRQALDPVGRPVLSQIEFGLGRGDARVIIEQRHRLAATVDNRLLGKRGLEVPYRRTGLVDPAIEPRFVDDVVLVVVALEVVDDQELLGAETPNVTFPKTDGLGLVDLADLPKVGRFEIQRAGVVAGCIGGLHRCC